MYQSHFGLRESPFKLTPNPDYFFPGAQRGAILEALLYAIAEGCAVIKVVGEVGSGKTILCRMLAERLPATVETVYLANPSLAPQDVLQAIAFELGLPVLAGHTRLEVMRILQEHVLSQHAQGRQVVVLVDEAQGMPDATLEELRLLSNLETRDAKLLQIVLFGQPELDTKLARYELRQLRERISHQFFLPSLARDDVGNYLALRMHRAGSERARDMFTPGAIRALDEAAQGLVRRVNILAEQSLLAAYVAGAYQVDAGHVRAAVRDSAFGRSRKLRWPIASSIAAGVAVLAISGWAVLGSHAVQASVSAPVRAEQASADPEPSASPESSALSTPLLENLVASSHAHLASLPAKRYSIQLRAAQAGDPAQVTALEKFLRQAMAGQQGGPFYVLPAQREGRTWLNVLYGEFASYSAAREALAALPDAYKIHQPYVRSIGVARSSTISPDAA